MTSTTQSPTRSQLAMRNAIVSLLAYLLPTVAGFFMRRYFIFELGGDLTGLNGVVTSIIGFLNVTELGLASAIAFALYKPLYEGNHEEVREVISIQRFFYRWIARFIMLSGGIVSIFFPQIFADVELPLWYAYSTFIVMMASTMMSYYFNYRQVLFISDQRSYIVNLCVSTPRLFKLIAQTVALLYLSRPYVWWLSIELVGAIASTIAIEWSVRHYYPWLKNSDSPIRPLLQKHRDIVTRTKQLIFHRISTLILQQGARIVVFAVTTIYTVMLYDNYMMIYSGLLGVIGFIFSSLTGSIGNLLVENQQYTDGAKRSERTFKQFLSFRVYIGVVVVAMLYLFMPSLISVWVGADKLFDTPTFYIFLLFVFLNIVRQCDDFIAASGMFQDIWAPVIEMLLNLGLSIWLGSLFGIQGVLIGVAISLILVVHIWKPYFLYHYGFRLSVWHYWWEYLILLGVGFISLYWIHSILRMEEICVTFGDLIVDFLWRGSLALLIVTVQFLAIVPSFRQMMWRISKTMLRR